MPNRDIIVVGASAGGVEALSNFVKSLPLDLKATIFIVLHVPPYTKSFLPEILSKLTILPVSHPADGDRFKEGNIYIAPPDHHLIIERGNVAVKKGPKENRFRPSVDALFRSAAYVYSNRVIGIVLSGALDDGSSGLWSVKRMGGIAIVQDPLEAAFPEMPVNATKSVEVDYVVPLTAMGSLIGKLSSEPASSESDISEQERKLLEMEVKIATRDNAFELGIMKEGELTPFTCPDCHGVLVKFMKGKISQFRCHTGHSFTASALLSGITENNENLLSQAMRSMEEAAMLLDSIGRHFEKSGDIDSAKLFLRKAQENKRKARDIHDAVVKEERLSEDARFDN